MQPQASSDAAAALEQKRGTVSRLVDTYAACGKVFFSTREAAAATNLSLLAAQRQIVRLTYRVTRLPGRPEAFLIVPPEHRANGAPPVSWWLDAYMHHRGQPYYLGLLSAADLHGSSQQAVQVAQVLTDRPTRPIMLGRIRVEFHVKKGVAETPVMQPQGMHSTLAVSTPEATAMDLVEYVACIGGMRRAVEVISGLKPVMSVTGLRAALNADTRRTAQQRLGFVLQTLEWPRLAAEVARRLAQLGDVLSAAPPPLALQVGTPIDVTSSSAQPWNVIDNIGLRNLLP